MYEFEIYQCADAGNYAIGTLIKRFKDSNVDKAFGDATAWIQKQYNENDNGPDYIIVSKFGNLHY